MVIYIEGPIDNALFKSMIRGVQERGATPTVVRWIAATFEKVHIVSRLSMRPDWWHIQYEAARRRSLDAVS